MLLLMLFVYFCYVIFYFGIFLICLLFIVPHIVCTVFIHYIAALAVWIFVCVVLNRNFCFSCIIPFYIPSNICIPFCHVCACRLLHCIFLFLTLCVLVCMCHRFLLFNTYSFSYDGKISIIYVLLCFFARNR